MRVIAGKARRIQLKTAEGMDTRPTTDRIKETLFNMLGDRVYGCDFLDLYSGSGGIAIEALSRGARSAVLVERDRRAIACIRDNLERTHLAGQAELLCTDCEAAIDRLGRAGRRFDIIFMDPPYDHEHEKAILSRLLGKSLADADTLIIVEASLETDFSYLAGMGYDLVREKNYKTNKHMFVKVIGEIQ